MGKQGAKSIPDFHSMLPDACWFSNSLLDVPIDVSHIPFLFCLQVYQMQLLKKDHAEELYLLNLNSGQPAPEPPEMR